MGRITYKGRTIDTSYLKGMDSDHRFVACILDASGKKENTYGSSEEDAIEYLKQKIDFCQEVARDALKPLTEAQLEQLRCYVTKKSKSIIHTLRKDHIIPPGKYEQLTKAAIKNHYQLIADALSEATDTTINLTCIFFENKYGEIGKTALALTDYATSHRDELESLLSKS